MPTPLLDHVFICTAAGAPAASALLQLGLLEGTPNRHPGQGTACRRFFFRNAMLELLWVEDEAEARETSDPRMRLWERWSNAGRSASPFGIMLRSPTGSLAPCPFRSWQYRPALMPGLVLQIALDTSLQEPMWFYVENTPLRQNQPVVHPIGFQTVTGLRLVSPPLDETSLTRTMARQQVISLDSAPEYRMELEFDEGQKGASLDLRPALPLVCRW